MAGILAGDQSALGVLYDRHADAVFRLSYRLLGDRGLAEEVLQETILAVWNRAELYDPRIASLPAWLMTIARNRSVDRLRARGRRPALLSLSAAGGSAGSDGAALDAALAGGGAGGGRRRHPRDGAGRTGRPARRRAPGDRAGLLRGAVAERDRRAAGMAAGHGQDAYAPCAPAAARHAGRDARTGVGRPCRPDAAAGRGPVGRDRWTTLKRANDSRTPSWPRETVGSRRLSPIRARRASSSVPTSPRARRAPASWMRCARSERCWPPPRPTPLPRRPLCASA